SEATTCPVGCTSMRAPCRMAWVASVTRPVIWPLRSCATSVAVPSIVEMTRVTVIGKRRRRRKCMVPSLLVGKDEQRLAKCYWTLVNGWLERYEEEIKTLARQ